MGSFISENILHLKKRYAKPAATDHIFVYEFHTIKSFTSKAYTNHKHTNWSLLFMVSVYGPSDSVLRGIRKRRVVVNSCIVTILTDKMSIYIALV